MAPTEESHAYHAKDAINESFRAALITGTAGALFAGIQNTLTKQNVGASGFFTKYGGTTATFIGMGASYGFVKNVAANLREQEDPWNTAAGGFFAGAIAGMKTRTLPAVLGMGTMLAVITGIMDYTGGTFRGRRDPDVDAYAVKEANRKTYRRPEEDTVAELGEGRGIYGAGYQERRKQRLKEKYGIEVS